MSERVEIAAHIPITTGPNGAPTTTLKRTAMAMITLYTKPACPQCDATKRHLNKLGLEYTTVDLSVDIEAFAMVQELGHRAAPVLIAGDASWAGYQPDKINQLAAAA